MKVAFHKPSGVPSANGQFFDKVIEAVTRSPYTHSELVFDLVPGYPANSLCFSSAPVDGGVRFKRIDLSQPDWIVVDVPGEKDYEAMDLAKFYLGQKYDWMGILGFTVPWGAHKDNDKFCSEVCTLILQECRILDKTIKSFRTSPADLYKLVTNAK